MSFSGTSSNHQTCREKSERSLTATVEAAFCCNTKATSHKISKPSEFSNRLGTSWQEEPLKEQASASAIMETVGAPAKLWEKAGSGSCPAAMWLISNTHTRGDMKAVQLPEKRVKKKRKEKSEVANPRNFPVGSTFLIPDSSFPGEGTVISWFFLPPPAPVFCLPSPWCICQVW